MNLNILVLDDEEGYRMEISEFLVNNGCQVHKAATPAEAFQIIEKNKIEVAIVDIRLPEMDGIEVLRRIRSFNPDIEVIMITGHGDMESVINSLRAGAADFLRKPFSLNDIYNSIEKTQKYIRFLSEGQRAATKDEIDDAGLLGSYLIGNSAEMVKLRKLIQKVAQTQSDTILITGESGTGKELVAKAIHRLSERSENIFLPVNCSAIPQELFESEFFGYKKGAFTGAAEDRKGWLESADKGTMFLDEIGDMRWDQQSKLLRVIEDKMITVVGTKELKKVDVRIIAATNQDLQKNVAGKTFREDLYYRLNYLTIHVPPLRERKVDIPELFHHFVEQYAKKMNTNFNHIDKKVLDVLSEYDFPGNVRELKNMTERALILNESGHITYSDFHTLPYLYRKDGGGARETDDDLNLDKIEKAFIIKALNKSGHNKTQAARLLGISRQALDRKIIRYSIITD